MSKPSISIIIPAWNASGSIRHIVGSVLSQPFSDFELILVDDGSTDDTLSMMKDLEKTDRRIRVLTKPNGGPSSARNLGLEKATGKYIQFYDSDDDISDNALGTVVDAISTPGSDLLISGWQIDIDGGKEIMRGYKQIGPSPEIISDNLTEYILRSLGSGGTLYNLWNKLFRADVIKDSGIRFCEDLRFGEDLLFSLEYMNNIKSIQLIPDITYHYLTNRKTSVFSSSSLVPEYRTANDQAIVRFAGSDPSATERALLNWLRRRWLMSYWSMVAGSQKTLPEKISLISQFKPVNIKISSPKYIGVKKYCLQIAAQIAQLTNIGSLIFGWSMNLIKRVIFFIKTMALRR